MSIRRCPRPRQQQQSRDDRRRRLLERLAAHDRRAADAISPIMRPVMQNPKHAKVCTVFSDMAQRLPPQSGTQRAWLPSSLLPPLD